MSLFNYTNYRAYLSIRISSFPQQGRGQLRKIADRLRVHPTLITQILKGSKQLTLDQAMDLAEYLELGDLETDYFLAIVTLERAGNPKLRARLKRQLMELREKVNPSGSESDPAHPLGPVDQTVYYSQWYYTAIHVMTAIPRFQRLQDTPLLAKELRMPEHLVRAALEFLVKTRLCREADGRVQIQVKDTKVPAGSPLIDRHLTNWRLKGIEQITCRAPHPEDLFYSIPMAVGGLAGQKLRQDIQTLIDRALDAPKKQSVEAMACLNIDWFYLRP